MQISKVNKHNNSSQVQNQSKNDFPLSNSQIQHYKQTFDYLSLGKKKNYLHAIQCHNQELVNKIKELDRRINSEMDSLGRKIVPVQKRKAGAQKLFQQVQTQELTDKFMEYQKLKKQLELKKTGIDSLQFLLLVKKQEGAKIVNLDRQITQVKAQIQKLQKLKQKSQQQEMVLKKQLLKVGQFSMFDNQIDELRRKVKQKNETIKSKKQQFLNMYKRNRSSNKSMVVDQLPKQTKMGQSDGTMEQLKRQYYAMGRKNQYLKNKKINLQRQLPNQGQLKRQLEGLKNKYQSLAKLGSKFGL